MKTGLCSWFCCDYQAVFALPLKALIKTSVAPAGNTSCDHLSKSRDVFQSVCILCRAQTWCSKASYRFKFSSGEFTLACVWLSSSSPLSLPPHLFLWWNLLHGYSRSPSSTALPPTDQKRSDLWSEPHLWPALSNNEMLSGCFVLRASQCKHGSENCFFIVSSSRGNK